MTNSKPDQEPKFWDRTSKYSESFKTGVIIALVFGVGGVILGYFQTIDLTNQARSDWIQAQNAQVSKAQSR